MEPVLVACSHGTASPEGQAAVRGLVDAVARRRPDLQVRSAYVDVQEPSPAEVLARLGGRPARLVPLLLSAGYHVFVDLTDAAAAAAAGGTTVAPALGPDRRLAELIRARLGRRHLRTTDTVVLAAAGSSNEFAVADCETAATQLGELLGRRVTAAYLTAGQPRLTDVVANEHAAGRGVLVATYLLAPGSFADRAANCGAEHVTAPLLLAGEPPPEAIVDIVLQRFS
ncbi:MAG: cobalamin biosynthesis protein CbiX [Intrasporangium sp.]|uniref:sirohydrochlorin chelatase n=1 Tax=Intrasporangium sp. TaxID=1925024 RepID=UPI002647608F|nr:CbiX/SirB N-terminal domain-containing protein [Intrasporangium sp.]MDN5797729.1 cobalamin biosynthesis protein CbiX [Intrasporangium sp.]